jgi:GNAT superfamily N-acetyltransferase
MQRQSSMRIFASHSPSVSSEEEMPNLQLLDNPIWNSLQTGHSNLAIGNGLARRYPPEIGPLSGIPEQSAEAYNALRALAGDGALVLFLNEVPEPPPGWTLLRGGLVNQMICQDWRRPEPIPLHPLAELRPLTTADVPAMVELAELTEPGPFRNRTNELGAFFGVFESSRLMSMAGQRMRLPGLVEVSAVCTHPDARGRGYARILMSKVMEDIFRQGDTPFLHVLASNHSAIRVYEALGFTYRHTFQLAVLKSS